jgi:hypothetical protein
MPPPPRRGQRIAAAVVAFAVFGAAAALSLGAFSRDGSTVPVAPGPGGLVIVLDGTGNIATAELRFDDRTAEPQVGSHCWEQDNAEACMDTVLSPFAAADFLTVPRGTPVAIQADDELASTEVRIDPGADPSDVYRNVPSSPIDAINVTPGRYVLTVSADWPRGQVEFYFAVQIVAATASSPAPTPSASRLVATLNAPDDGSMPRLTLSFGGDPMTFAAQDGRWPGVSLSPIPPQRFDPAIDPRTTISIDGDADRVEGTLFIADADQRETGESIPLDLTSGSATLPHDAGYFRLVLVGTWPDGEAGFNVGITIGTPSDAWPPPPPIAVVPDVIGLDEHDAVARLTAAGFVSVSVAIPADGSTGVVVSSDPPAGTSTAITTTILLSISANR